MPFAVPFVGSKRAMKRQIVVVRPGDQTRAQRLETRFWPHYQLNEKWVRRLFPRRWCREVGTGKTGRELRAEERGDHIYWHG